MPLRSLTEDDLPRILVWRNAPAVRLNSFTSREISEAEHRKWFASMTHDPTSRWYVYESNEGVPSGVVALNDYRPANRSSFWGFYTAPDAEPGTGTRLGIAALDEAFDALGLHKLNAEVLARNERSLRFHQKLGFSREGLFRESHFDGQRYVDVVRFGILDVEWHRRRSGLAQAIRH